MLSAKFVRLRHPRRGPSPCFVLACWLTLVMTAQPAMSDEPPDAGQEILLAAANDPVRKLEEPVHTDVRASSFQEITPGETTRAELIGALGDPLQETEGHGEVTLSYQIGPFPRVELIVVDGRVDSIVVHLNDASKPEEIAAELGLTSFAPAPIYGEAGEPLGQVYPERGVAFSFEPNTEPPRVRQLVLAPISSEFFLLRAQDDVDTNYQRKLADLNFVLSGRAENAAARGLKAEILFRAGYLRRALTVINEALELEPDNSEYRLLRATLRGQLGEHSAALEEAKEVLARESREMVQARAEALLGDLLAKGPSHDYRAAMKHHLAAVELSVPLATSPHRRVRRAAKQLLAKVHLAIANDITHGEWTSKKETAPKWLRTARTLTDQSIAQEGGDEALRLLLFQQALASYVGMRGVVDPTEVAEEALEFGSGLISKATDTFRQRELQWLLVESLFEAVRIEQLRGKTESAVAYATEAEALLKTLAASEESTERTDFFRGRLFFYVGATFAVHGDNHPQAVRWYERAQPHLTRTRPTSDNGELLEHGQRFVSMGVSYWESSFRNEAIRLTELGLRMMSTAVEKDKMDGATLAVPYGNLAAMYKEVGRRDEAKKLAAKAASLESRDASNRNR